MGKVNRNTLQSYFQGPGDTYDDTKTEGAINTLADQIDANDTDFSDLNANVYRKTEVDSKINNVSSTKTVAAGSTFPVGTYTDGQEFYRNDLKALYVYDAATAGWVIPVSDGAITLAKLDTNNKKAVRAGKVYAYKNLGGF